MTTRKPSDDSPSPLVSRDPDRDRAPRGAATIQPAKTRAIEQALFEEWAAQGYGALSMEGIARRAGVGKAALYRRWASKQAMVTTVLTRIGTELVAAPDTGDLAQDIRLLLLQLRRILRHRLIGRILPDLHAEMARNPELATVIRSTVQVERRDRYKAVFRRAVGRGELPADLDLDLATDLVGSMIYWRIIVTRQRTDGACIEALTRLILAALGAGHSAPAPPQRTSPGNR